jgi:hypothetical protein
VAGPVAVAPARYRTTREVRALVRRFDETTLPREEWTHEAHLVVALDIARRHRPQEAVTRLRASIKRLNAAHGTPETETRGYHETITLAWFHLVRHFLEVFDDGRSLAALVDALVERFAAKDALFEHYSRERLLSREARARWVEPDLRPLPALEPFARQDQEWLQSLDARAATLTAKARRAVALAS